jgi:hypothetical protein
VIIGPTNKPHPTGLRHLKCNFSKISVILHHNPTVVLTTIPPLSLILCFLLFGFYLIAFFYTVHAHPSTLIELNIHKMKPYKCNIS